MTPAAPRSGKSALALLAFLPLLGLWTWKLLQPHPLPVEMEEWFAGWNTIKLVAAKVLHATVYALLTLLAGVWLPPRKPPRLLALSLLMFHGVLTEILQTMIPNRSGRAWDVMIDWAGIAAGLLLGRSRWRSLR